MRLGAHQFILTEKEDQLKKVNNYFDFIIDTISSDHDNEKCFCLLSSSGTLILLGFATEPMKLPAIHMVFKRLFDCHRKSRFSIF